MCVFGSRSSACENTYPPIYASSRHKSSHNRSTNSILVNFWILPNLVGNLSRRAVWSWCARVSNSRNQGPSRCTDLLMQESKSRTEAHVGVSSSGQRHFFGVDVVGVQGRFAVENFFRCFYIVQSFHHQRHCMFTAFGGICLSTNHFHWCLFSVSEDIRIPRKRTTRNRSVTTDWGCAIRRTNRLGSCRSFVWDSKTCHQT